MRDQPIRVAGVAEHRGQESWGRKPLWIGGALLALGAVAIVLQACNKRWASNAVAYGVGGAVSAVAVGLLCCGCQPVAREPAAGAIGVALGEPTPLVDTVAAARQAVKLRSLEEALARREREVREQQQQTADAVTAGRITPSARLASRLTDQNTEVSALLDPQMEFLVGIDAIHRNSNYLVAIREHIRAEKELLVAKGLSIQLQLPWHEQALEAGQAAERQPALAPLASRMILLIHRECRAGHAEIAAIDALPEEDSRREQPRRHGPWSRRGELDKRRAWLVSQIGPMARSERSSLTDGAP
jgi:hypothetical protein